jgi:hypothetical protein
VQRIPLLLRNVLEIENSVEGKDKSVVRAERIEHRAVAARDGRERVLVHRREMVVLGERVDREFPVDRAVQHLLAQRRPSADAPRVQFVDERPEERRDVQRRVAVQRNPQEAGTFGSR